MLVKKIGINDPLGLHLRVAAQLAKTASNYKCKITVKNHNGHANGKSILNLLALSAIAGSELTIILEGVDASAAWNAIDHLFHDTLGVA